MYKLDLINMTFLNSYSVRCNLMDFEIKVYVNLELNFMSYVGSILLF